MRPLTTIVGVDVTDEGWEIVFRVPTPKEPEENDDTDRTGATPEVQQVED